VNPLEAFAFPVAAGALLLAGHMLAEYVTGPEGTGDHPRGWRGFLRHGCAVLAWHTLLLFPLALPGMHALLLAAPLAAAGHVIVDALAARLPLHPSRSLERTFLDQAAHLAVLWGTLLLILPGVGSLPLAGNLGGAINLPAFGLVVASFAFNWGGGAAVVHGVLARFRLEEDPPGGHGESVPGSGRAIGILERLLLLPLVILGEWGGIGLILAAKSLARFKELDFRPFAEYYLIGTLTSVVVATATGLLVRVLLGI